MNLKAISLPRRHKALANGGQCYPVIVRNKTHSIEFCKVNGLPLGNRARDPYQEKTLSAIIIKSL
jgi:hypothetical protein